MPVDPTVAYRRVRQLSGSGPTITPAKAHAVAIGLRRAADQAPAIVAQQTELFDHLEDVQSKPVSVLARPGWAQAAALSVSPFLDNLVRDSKVQSRVVSEELGIALAVMAPRILGQYDPFALTALPGQGLPIEGRLLLIAPNVFDFSTDWNLDIRDVQLFVCVHEFTHAFQFTAAPWLKDVLVSRVSSALAAMDEGMMEEELDGIMAIMTVLEGHAEYVMNTVPIARIPSRKRITAAIKSRRQSGSQISKFVKNLLGFDLKVNQYEDGEKFVDHVVRLAGHEGFNRVWETPMNLPTPDELKDPQSWCQRVLS
ncbi:MAG: zinc-dependent metalloprotease [Flaviflexus sp.]|uniref:zinc-dependent metalloprotease n=1 Tax=Flaviflexus sp. TaxID=1969482 RepID=UPI00352DAD5D